MASKPRMVATIGTEEPSPRLAVLIDADNAQPSLFKPLLKEIARYGEATVKRIYGDFTAPQSAQWRKVLQQHAIQPRQQFAYTTGKNATDSALIIDAMDLLYTRRYDGFCLVSSDSDFTGLAARIREEGLLVYGFGRRTTPEAFRQACHKFIFDDLLEPDAEETPAPRPAAATEAPPAPKAAVPAKAPPAAKVTAPAEAPPAAKVTAPTETPPPARDFPHTLLLDAIEKRSNDGGWAHLGTLGSYLSQIQPDFDPRTFGHKKLSDLIRSRPDLLEVEERAGALYIRLRAPR